MEYLFVYGTLMDSMDNPFAVLLRANSEYVDEGCFYGRLYDLGGYPGAVSDKGVNSSVKGQIFRLSESRNIIDELDRYEEVGRAYPIPNEYRRESISVYTHGGKSLFCWVYLYNWSTNGLPIIESGNYKTYLSSERFDE